jgi:hypothetical protein
MSAAQDLGPRVQTLGYRQSSLRDWLVCLGADWQPIPNGVRSGKKI